MRGIDHQQSQMFSYLSPETRVRKDHPLRVIRAMVDEVLTRLSPRFDAMYASSGRPSIPPEKLLRTDAADAVLDSQRAATDGRDRLQHLVSLVCGAEPGRSVVGCDHIHQEPGPAAGSGSGKEFLAQVVAQARAKGLTSDEHFTVDGTLVEAWASLKSFRRIRMKRIHLRRRIPGTRPWISAGSS